MRRGMPSIQHCARDRVVFAAACRLPDCSSCGGRSDASTTLRASRFRRCSPGPMHTARTGRWPTGSSGPCLEAPGEHWGSLISAIHEGQRGLPGGSTFAQLLIKHRGHRSKGHAPRLSIPQILAWAEAFHTRHGKWPTSALRTRRRRAWRDLEWHPVRPGPWPPRVARRVIVRAPATKSSAARAPRGQSAAHRSGSTDGRHAQD